MSVLSLAFLLFLAAFTVAYYLVPRFHTQNVLLTGMSLIFCGWIHPWFAGLLAGYAVLAWAGGLALHSRRERARAVFALCAALCLALLGVFKYFNFFAANIHAALCLAGPGTRLSTLNLLLPLGISYYTFRVLGYLADVYKGSLAPRRNFADVAAFVTFFPELPAGPIERGADLLPQLEKQRRWDSDTVAAGALLMLWGFFKKLVIADTVAITANKVFLLADPAFPVLWAGVFAFTIQIYADFSGYTDIARGAARLLGLDAARNFDHPYLAPSPRAFWRRWHISLSFWLRDYVYIPLGGSRVSAPRRAFNTLATFVLIGLWHGASWHFVLWGAYHGLLLVIQRALAGMFPWRMLRTRPARALGIPLTFTLVAAGWLIFREPDLHYLLKYFTLSPRAATAFHWDAALFLCLHTALYALPLLAHALYARRRDALLPTPAAARLFHALLGAALALGLILLHATVAADFIYARF